MFKPTLLIAVVLLVSVLALSQETKKPLTNADVVTMVKGGLPEDTIVLAIGSSPGNYDTSPQALIALKQQGVSQKLLDAILRSNQTQAMEPSAPEEPDGAFFQDANGKQIRLTSPPDAESKTKTGILAGMAGVSPDVVNVYAGAEAPTRIAVLRPEFIVRRDPRIYSDDPRTIWIVALERKKKTREVRTLSVGMEAKVGVREKDRREVSVTKIAGGWKVVPKADLSPGEYLLTLDPLFVTAYEFGIDSPKQKPK